MTATMYQIAGWNRMQYTILHSRIRTDFTDYNFRFSPPIANEDFDRVHMLINGNMLGVRLSPYLRDREDMWGAILTFEIATSKTWNLPGPPEIWMAPE